ncbi:epoxide hydrolase family protein [Pseudonocardia sp. RS010]|uniref:epoxide hydrolase family protein n=1 Tax=Pseudonocardia sp. RS010 TaxID=3385979 RepID=UPI0039A2DAEA
MELTPFRVETDQAELDDLKRRIAATRWPDQIPGSGWDYGTDGNYLRELCAYWESTFDWRRVEDDINRWPQFLTTIDDQRIHFIHARSKEAGATPLLLCHGWPGSVLEFMKMIGPLTDPVAHGGTAADAFHVVCPSLPGYAWSGPTTEAGWDTKRIAAAFAELMTGLGYDRFGAQGGDWGSAVSVRLAQDFPERMIGIHINMVTTSGPQPEDGELTAEESEFVAEAQRYSPAEEGYIAIQSTKPQTIAYALNDSPAGLAAWIVEKFRKWTDCDGDVEKALTRDEILAGVTAYWLTQTAGSSGRLYYEAFKAMTIPPPPTRIELPVGCAIFPKELYQSSRRQAERHYNVQRWANLPRGGHFAALEQPELLTGEIRAFFGALRTASTSS